MTALLTLTRAVHFGSCLVFQAIFAVLLLVATPAWRQAEATRSAACARYSRKLRRLLVGCLLAAVVSGFLWIWLAIVGMSGASLGEALSPGLFSMVLTQTQPGHVWLVQMGLALLLAVALAFVARRPSGQAISSPAWWLGALAAAAFTASLAWLGHAGASEGPEQSLQLAGDIIHLLSAGIWPAGLVPFVLFLRCTLPAGDPAALFAARLATRKFSALSLLAVAVLALSGMANSYYLVGTFHALVASEYGHWLLLKLALFAATIGIGAWNLFLCQSQLAGGELSRPPNAEGLALAKVTRNVLLEIVLCTLILLVVGLLGITAPAGHS